MHLGVLRLRFGALVPCLHGAASVGDEYEAARGEVVVGNEDNDGCLTTNGKPK
ncbi:E2-like enzyme, partial [Sarracenia purpurea var. burkii]